MDECCRHGGGHGLRLGVHLLEQEAEAALMGKFTKFTIAEDIEKYLRKEKLIKKTWSIVIPEGGYDTEPDEDYDMWSGSFEVFSDPRTVAGNGKFQAQVLGGTFDKRYDDYALLIVWKGKERWIYG